MSPERTSKEGPKYFTQEDLWPRIEHLLPPDCSWPEMLARGEVLAPDVLVAIFQEALEFLITEPGPNLEKRKLLAPRWLNFWIYKIRHQSAEAGSQPGLVLSGKVLEFDKVKNRLETEGLAELAGSLFVAGAEGHAGHVHALNYMTMCSVFPVWIFEQDSYFAQKKRQLPFLPLVVRLGMWSFTNVGILTVSPQRSTEVSVNAHYRDLFARLGASISCFSEDDPYFAEKYDRGQGSYLVIPKLAIDRTTDHVERLLARLPGVDDVSFLNCSLRLPISGESWW